MGSTSTIEGLAARSREELGAQRRLYASVTAVLCALVGLAVTDALQLTNAFGVRSETARASGGGYDLEVRYGSVTRPGLATPFRIEVTSPGGFAGPVTVAVDRSYLRIWDENGLSPAPASETVRGPWIDWEFDPPDGDVLVITYDARIEPAAQWSHDGAVQLLDDGEPVAEVTFTTRLMP